MSCPSTTTANAPVIPLLIPLTIPLAPIDVAKVNMEPKYPMPISDKRMLDVFARVPTAKLVQNEAMEKLMIF